jgi:hypothetical protein
MVALGVPGRLGRVESATPLAAKSSSSVRKGHIVAGLREFVSLRRELQIWHPTFISSVETVNSTLTKQLTLGR